MFWSIFFKSFGKEIIKAFKINNFKDEIKLNLNKDKY